MSRTTTRIARPSVAVALALGLLLSGVVTATGASAHPGLEEHARHQETVGAGAQASLQESVEGVPRYFLRRDDCGGANDNPHLSLIPGNPDGGDGCGFIPPGWNALNEAFAALGDEEGLFVDFPARDGLPFTLDGSTDITGTIVIQSFRGVAQNPGGLGAGISRVHLTLTGKRTGQPGTDTLGQATEEYLVTPAQQTYEIDFAMPAPGELDGIDYQSLNLRVRLDGPAANHGFIALSGRSFIDLPGTAGEGGPVTDEPLEPMSNVPCVDGMAGPFECDGIDLLSFMPRDEFNAPEGGVSDLWGWTDPETGDEYVIMGKLDGTAFFRVTDPFNPVYLGELPNPGLLQGVWHDMKVFENHAFIVSESDHHGMAVFDLTRLRGVEEPQVFDRDAEYPLPSSAHNIAINEDTGFAYIVGGNFGIVAPDQCLSGLHMVDINDPTNPTFAGCFLMDGGPGTAGRTVGGAVEENSPAAYVHDTQCVIYEGPDERYTGRELCFNASEDQVTIADVTNKLLPTTVGTVTYENVAYAHQGWLSEDQRFLFVNDELDESEGLVDNTRTIVLDVSDLENPKVHFEHFHDTVSPDHNNYVHEGLLYQSNYSSGLRVLDTASVDDPVSPRLEPLAFFDTFPAAEDTFDGTWSNYPFFESGTIAVSGRNEGLFLLRLSEDPTEGASVEIDCLNCPLETGPGQRRNARLMVSNVGDVDDVYDMSVGDVPDGWRARIRPVELSVDMGDRRLARLGVVVPRDAAPGTYTLLVTATSTADPSVSATEPVQVVVEESRP